MIDFIKKYQDWKTVLESEETDPPSGDTVSSLMVRLINNEKARGRVIKLINSSIKKLLKSFRKTESLTVPEIGAIKISVSIPEAYIKSITPNEGSNGSSGIIKGRLLIKAVVSGDMITDFVPAKERTLYVYASVTAGYNVNETEDQMSYKITSVSISGKKELKSGPFQMNPIKVSLKNNKLTLSDLPPEKAVYLKDKDLGISSKVVGQSGQVALTEELLEG